MNTFVAHLKPGRPPLLHREGWSWAAAIFGPLWLLVRRAWIPALLELAAIAIVVALAPARVDGPLLLGLAALNLLLGRDLVAWSLERRGYLPAHVLLARNADAAWLRLLTARPDLLDGVR